MAQATRLLHPAFSIFNGTDKDRKIPTNPVISVRLFTPANIATIAADFTHLNLPGSPD